MAAWRPPAVTLLVSQDNRTGQNFVRGSLFACTTLWCSPRRWRVNPRPTRAIATVQVGRGFSPRQPFLVRGQHGILRRQSCDITPPGSQWLLGYQARQSNGIHDRIYHRVVGLEAGRTQFYLISSDLCLFSPTLYDSVTRDLQKETGIDPAHVWWSVTHTHAAPEVGPPDMYKVLLGRSDHEWERE